MNSDSSVRPQGPGSSLNAISQSPPGQAIASPTAQAHFRYFQTNWGWQRGISCNRWVLGEFNGRAPRMPANAGTVCTPCIHEKTVLASCPLSCLVLKVEHHAAHSLVGHGVLCTMYHEDSQTP